MVIHLPAFVYRARLLLEWSLSISDGALLNHGFQIWSESRLLVWAEQTLICTF